jgi:hypothetical protein
MQEMFVPSLIEIGHMFLLKDSFQYTNVKIVSPLLPPTLTLGDNNLYKLKFCTYKFI